MKRKRRIRNGHEQEAYVVFDVDERRQPPVIVGEVVRFNGGTWVIDAFAYLREDPMVARVTAVRG